MSDSIRPAAHEVMEAAKREFLSAARAAVQQIRVVGQELVARPGDAGLLEPMRRELHRLNGSAGTFGFARAGRMAAALEGVVRRWQDDPTLDAARRASVVAGFASAMGVEFRADGTAPAVRARRLLLVGVRDAHAARLTAEAGARGYVVERVAQGELADALDDGIPDAIVAAAPLPAFATLEGVPTVVLGNESDPPSATLAALAGQAAAAREAAGSVIVVDDDPVMRALIQVAAEQAQLAVVVTADGDAFRAALATASPTLIVIDIEVGALSGLDLVREVRAQATFADTPVVVMSGHSDDATRAAATAAGATDYLTKPISLPVLSAKLAAWGTRA